MRRPLRRRKSLVVPRMPPTRTVLPYDACVSDVWFFAAAVWVWPAESSGKPSVEDQRQVLRRRRDGSVLHHLCGCAKTRTPVSDRDIHQPATRNRGDVRLRMSFGKAGRPASRSCPSLRAVFRDEGRPLLSSLSYAASGAGGQRSLLPALTGGGGVSAQHARIATSATSVVGRRSCAAKTSTPLFALCSLWPVDTRFPIRTCVLPSCDLRGPPR